MSEWLRVNPAEFSKPEQRKIHGMNVEVFVSPYDMPEAVRGILEADSKTFTIEFRYIGGDEPLEQVIQDRVTTFVGKHSERIYKIVLPMAKEQPVSLRLVPQVNAIIRQLEKIPSRRSGNYQVAKEIVSKRAGKLLERAAAD